MSQLEPWAPSDWKRMNLKEPKRTAERPLGRSAVQNGLFTNAELGDDGTVSFDIRIHQVVQQTTTLSNQFEQTATGGVVFRMCLQMLRQFVDTRGEDGNLHFCRTSVRGGLPELLNEFSFSFFRDHVRTSLD